MRKTILAAVLAAVIIPGMPANAQAVRDANRDYRNDVRDAEQDRRNALRDADSRRDVRDANRDYRNDVRDARQDRRNDIRDDRQDRRRDARNWQNYRNYDYNRFENGARGYYADRYYRDGSNYQPRRLTRNDRVYRGSDNRYYCRRSDGTTGLIIGGLAGGLLGNTLASGGSRTLGTLLGAGGGALLGQSVDRGQVVCR